MGSLRSPVGPLPSSIYWRRRLVVLLLVALVVILVVWALASGGGGGSEPTGDDKSAPGPADSITPGPTPSQSFIDERPGGRDEPRPDPEPSGSEDGDGEGDADGDGDTDGGAGGTAGGGEVGGVGGAAEGADGGAGGDSGGLPVGGLPDCGARDVTLSLASEENEYALGEDPRLTLTVRNVSGVACRVDFGHHALTVTIADPEDNEVWSSAECPTDPASEPAAVSPGGSATHAITWDRRHSTTDCDGPRGAPAATGTSYLAEAKLAGVSQVPLVSFVLDDD